jgi:hypothetical protein
LWAKSNEEFGKKINLKTNYSSHKIQDELLNICTDVVKEIIVKDIEDVEVFGIMCDEVRWNINYVLYMDFLIYFY